MVTGPVLAWLVPQAASAVDASAAAPRPTASRRHLTLGLMLPGGKAPGRARARSPDVLRRQPALLIVPPALSRRPGCQTGPLPGTGDPGERCIPRPVLG